MPAKKDKKKTVKKGPKPTKKDDKLTKEQKDAGPP